MKKLLLIAALLALSGCASVQGIQDTNDTLIKGWEVAGCATPLSAILRNPQIIPALNSLCKPVNGAPPDAILK